MVKGEVVFPCEENFGGFIRGKNVKVGDYPVADDLNMDDEDEEI